MYIVKTYCCGIPIILYLIYIDFIFCQFEPMNSLQSIIRKLSVRFVIIIIGGRYCQFLCVLELQTRCIYNIGRLSFRCLHVLRHYTIHNHHHIVVIFLLVTLCTLVLDLVQQLWMWMFAVLQCRSAIIFVYIYYIGFMLFLHYYADIVNWFHKTLTFCRKSFLCCWCLDMWIAGVQLTD